MTLIIEENTSRNKEYEDYLDQHIGGVQKAYDQFIKPILYTDTDLTIEEIEQLETNIKNHDKSKYDEEEWTAYLDWFYPDDEHPQDEAAFDRAWNHHQKCNPHHWQFWILQKDSGEERLLDMPEIYVLEMLSDWHSFSIKDPKSTAESWWNNNRDKMKMSKETISLVEKYIVLFKEPIHV